jgi:hypothetical protein
VIKASWTVIEILRVAKPFRKAAPQRRGSLSRDYLRCSRP